jgi:hypothetical protein
MLPPYPSYKHKKGKSNDSDDKFKTLNLKLKSKRHTMQTCSRVHKYPVSRHLNEQEMDLVQREMEIASHISSLEFKKQEYAHMKRHLTLVCMPKHRDHIAYSHTLIDLKM